MHLVLKLPFQKKKAFGLKNTVYIDLPCAFRLSCTRSIQPLRLSGTCFSDDEQFILFCQDSGEMDDALYEKLKHVLIEAENLKHEAYEETRRRQMAERELAEASKMVTKRNFTTSCQNSC
jgi:hypothetical protein